MLRSAFHSIIARIRIHSNSIHLPRAFAAILDKDRKRHGSNPTEEIPDATDDALISYQADIDETIEARSHGQTVSMGEGEGEAPDE